MATLVEERPVVTVTQDQVDAARDWLKADRRYQKALVELCDKGTHEAKMEEREAEARRSHYRVLLARACQGDNVCIVQAKREAYTK